MDTTTEKAKKSTIELIEDENVPLAMITIAVLAILIIIGLLIAKAVDHCHTRRALRDDASDISDFTKDVLKAQFMYAFNKKLLGKIRSKETPRQRARRMGRIWASKARRNIQAERLQEQFAEANKESNPEPTSPTKDIDTESHESIETQVASLAASKGDDSKDKAPAKDEKKEKPQGSTEDKDKPKSTDKPKDGDSKDNSPAKEKKKPSTEDKEKPKSTDKPDEGVDNKGFESREDSGVSEPDVVENVHVKKSEIDKVMKPIVVDRGLIVTPPKNPFLKFNNKPASKPATKTTPDKKPAATNKDNKPTTKKSGTPPNRPATASISEGKQSTKPGNATDRPPSKDNSVKSQSGSRPATAPGSGSRPSSTKDSKGDTKAGKDSKNSSNNNKSGHTDDVESGRSGIRSPMHDQFVSYRGESDDLMIPVSTDEGPKTTFKTEKESGSECSSRDDYDFLTESEKKTGASTQKKTHDRDSGKGSSLNSPPPK